MNSPAGIGAFAMDAGKDGIWVAGGGLQGTGGTNKEFGTYWFDDNNWKSFNKDNDPIYNSIYDKNTINVAVDPNNGKHAFVGSRGAGVLEYGENGTIRILNGTNSTIKPIDGDPGSFWVGGVDFDQDGNLWVLSNLNSGQLAEYTTAGTWKSFNIGAAYNGFYMFNLMVDSYNQKWANARGAGIVVFNENEPDNPNDNLVTMLTTAAGKGGLPYK